MVIQFLLEQKYTCCYVYYVVEKKSGRGKLLDLSGFRDDIVYCMHVQECNKYHLVNNFHG